ncbi:hypothetical protein NO135_20320, partial [Clostridioides difficile]|nr:hypothetical protein [Clostridioides difficile]
MLADNLARGELVHLAPEWQAAPLPVYLTYPHAQFYPSRLVRFAAMMRAAVPGLVEGHCHLMEGAMWDAAYGGYYDRRGPDGTLWPGLRSLDAVLERLAEAERAMTDDGPLLA